VPLQALAPGAFRKPPARAVAGDSRPMILEPLGQLHTLHPGDVVCAERGERMETLLGSCVAIVLTDPRRTLGAMCHIVHASRATAGVAETGAYAEVALDTMYALLRERGIDPAAKPMSTAKHSRNCSTRPRTSANAPRWALDAAEGGVRVLFHDLDTYRRLSWTVVQCTAGAAVPV
jgi:chemotaxis protein CheD